MALNKDTLGAAIYAVRQTYDNLTMGEIVNTFGSLEGVRLEIAKKEAEVIINHFKTFGVVATTGTASAQTGTIS